MTDHLLTAAWQAHDRWALTLRKRLISNSGQAITERLIRHQNRVANDLGITPSELIDTVTRHRREGLALEAAIALTLQGHGLEPW